MLCVNTFPACATSSRSKSVLAWRELHFLAAHSHDAPYQINAEVPGAEYWLLALLLQPMPLRGSDPCQQFLDAEGLRHIVVGPEIQRLHLCGLVAATGQDDDRHCRANVADPPDYLKSIDVRQTKIEHHDIGPFAPHGIQRLLAILRLKHHVALAAKAGAQKAQYRRLIIDNEHPEWASAFGHRMASSSRPVLTGTGSMMVNTAPVRSVRLAAVMVPCNASMKPRQMASPRPVPARRRSAPPAR